MISNTPNQLQCHLKDCSGRFADTEEKIKEHFSTTHQNVLEGRKATLTQLLWDCRKFNLNDGKAYLKTMPYLSPVEFVYAPFQDPALGDRTASLRESTKYWRDRYPAFAQSPRTRRRGVFDPNDPAKATTPIETRQSKRVRAQSQVASSAPEPAEDGQIAPLTTLPTSQELLYAEFGGYQRRDRPIDAVPHSMDSVGPAFGSKGRRNEPRSFLPVLVEGNAARALPDTEAGYNVVTENFAASMGAALDRDPRTQRTFTNAVGRKFQSCGIAELNIALPKDAGKVSRSKFAVLKKCAEPLVLGNPFLKENEIFTKVGYSHDLVKAVSSSVAASSKKMFRVMHMEQPRQKLTCELDSQHALANADTGSDIDLVSLRYAQSRGWKIKRINEDEESYVMLADEEEVQLAGYVEACLSVEGNEMMKRFYVLQDLVCDIILGDTTLESLDVFKNFKDAFVDWSQGKDSICMITWAKRFDKVGEDVEDILRRLDHAGGLSEGRSDRPWIRSIFSIRTKEPHRSDLEDIKYQLQSQLHKADSIEAEYRTEFAKKEVRLKDDALRREQEEDRRRREKHDQLRRRILKHIDNLSNQEHEPAGLRVAQA